MPSTDAERLTIKQRVLAQALAPRQRTTVTHCALQDELSRTHVSTVMR